MNVKDRLTVAKIVVPAIAIGLLSFTSGIVSPLYDVYLFFPFLTISNILAGLGLLVGFWLFRNEL